MGRFNFKNFMTFVTTDFSKNIVINKQFLKELPVPGKTGLDWFLFCYFINLYKSKPMLEIGAGTGGSLCTMLGFTDDLTLIDSWSQTWEKYPVEQCVKKINKTIRYIDCLSTDVDVKDLKPYAFVHLDANKDFDHTVGDLELVSSVCNGMICVDDYMNTMWPEVTWAVDYFVKNNPSWKKIFIGNHQIFLSQHTHQLKELIVDFPVMTRNDITCLTYGKLPSVVDKFVENSNMKYSWHSIAWDRADTSIL
jgi:hypothetical protein